MGSSSGADVDARAFAQRRVALYATTLTGFFAAFYVIDVIEKLAADELGRLAEPAQLAHLGVIVALAAGAALARRSPLPAAGLIAVEVGATALVAALAAVVAIQGPTGDAYAGPAFAIALVLVVRAAIVPCSALRTLAVGAAVATTIATAYHLRRDPMDLETVFVATWLVLFTVASAVVSRVIYGLQRRLREARKLGQYVLERRLGSGGMGVVYRARHSMLRRPTAVKLLPPGKTSKRALARFEREVRMTARLSHPNTVTVYDYGHTPDGQFYYAMELLDGATVDDVVAVDGAQPLSRVVHLLAAIADALTEAHGIGLIHRDIKPSNIMLCSQGGRVDTPRLLDFGLVSDVARDGNASLDNTVVGTPLYLSPESITAPDAVDARSDLYALGAVGYFMITGKHVFDGSSTPEICCKHLDETPTPPSARLGRPVDAELEAVVLACLAKAPADRPVSAAELGDRLRACRGIGAWTQADALAWWKRHGAALAARHAGAPASRPDFTFEVDPART